MLWLCSCMSMYVFVCVLMYLAKGALGWSVVCGCGICSHLDFIVVGFLLNGF